MPSLTRFIIKISIALAFGLVGLYIFAVFFEPLPRDMRHTIYDFGETVDQQEGESEAEIKEEKSESDEK